MRDFLVKRPMFLCALISSVVSVVAFYSETAIFILCIIFLATVFFMIYKAIKPVIIFAFIMALCVSVSVFLSVCDINYTKRLDGISSVGEFLVVEEPVNNGYYYSATVETVKSDSLKKGDKIYITYNEGDLKFAQKFKAEISLKSLENSKYEKYNYSEKIYINGYAKDIMPLDSFDFVLKTVGNIRNYIKQTIFENYSFREASTMLALVTGDKTYFTDKFDYNVKATGLSHVMVVSGMHLSVIVALFLILCDGVLYNRFLKAVIIFITVLLVCVVCGFTMSILRSGITYLLIAVSVLIKREGDPVNTLGGAVTIILLFNPFAIFNLSFQLSVLSTFGILAIALPIINFIKGKYIIARWSLGIYSQMLISISALIITTPLTIYVFGYISNIALITNLLVGFATTIALTLCVLGLIIPIFSEILFAISGMFVKYINWVINTFGSLPFAVSVLPEYTAVIAAFIVIGVFWVLLACKEKNNMLKLKEIEKIRTKKGGIFRGSNFGRGA